jgi:hypothetical protein
MGEVKVLILFVGDSYSANYDGWPSVIVNHYNADYINESMPGSSLNYMFSKLENQLKKNLPDVVIITITSGDRLFHPDMIIFGSEVHDNGTGVDKKIRKAVDQYYHYIYSSVNSDITSRIFNLAMASFTVKYPSIKFIILPCFHNWQHTACGNYVAFTPRLMEFSLRDEVAHKNEVAGIPAVRNNHLSYKQNINLANIIIEEINSYKFTNNVKIRKIDLGT